MPYDLKTEVADTTFPSGALLVGMDSQADARPKVYAQSTVWGYWKTLDNTWSGQQTFAAGTLAASKPLTITQTYNGGSGVTHNAFDISVTNTSSNSASTITDWKVGGTRMFAVMLDGLIRSAVGVHSTGSNLDFACSSFAATGQFRLNSLGVSQRVDGQYGFTAGNPGTNDTYWQRDAAGIMGLRGASAGAAGLSMQTYGASPPSAPAAGLARIYADTSGGKIRLMALFPSGAAQQLAIEP